ncbi:hypothetical protein, partial [Acidithiobacillus thiooxidans]|uniref:hypothetical protein n=1 Tax=Acidithiobacillus thiooxidans TaxID=930 RepID=UPI000AAFF702
MRESPLDPDGIKVPRWKFIHVKEKEDSSCRLQHTLTGLKRLMELVEDGDGRLSVVLAGHPKLRN